MRVNVNLVSGLVFLGFGILSLTVLIPYGIQQPSSVQYRALSPSYWPNIVSVAIALLGLALIIVNLTQKSALDPDEAPDRPIESRSGWLSARPFIALAICLALYFALEYLGFVLATAIALALLMLLAGEMRPHFVLPVALLIPMGLYLFFTKAASVPIPMGVLEAWLVRI